MRLKPYIIFAFYNFLLCANIWSQDNYSEKLRIILNDSQETEEDRLSAFSNLVRIDSFSNSAEIFLDENLNDSSNIRSTFLLKMKMAYSLEKSNFSEMRIKCTEILNARDCNGNDSINVFNTLATYYRRLGYYNNAIDNIIAVIKINDRKQNYFQSEQNYSDLASISMEQRSYEEALSSYYQSYNLNKDYEDHLYPYSMMNNIGLAHFYQKNIDSALYYFNFVQNYLENELPDSLRTRNTDFFLGLVVGNIGDVYLNNGEYEKAEPLLLFDIEKSRLAGEKENVAITQLNLAKIYLQTGKMDLAETYLDRASMIIENNNYRSIKRRFLLLCAKFYEKMNVHLNSSNYYKEYITLNDSINNEITQRKNIDLRLEYEAMSQEKEREIASIGNKKNVLELYTKKIQLYFSLGIVVLLLLILFVTYKNNRNKSKLNKELTLKNSEILIQSKEQEKTLREKNVLLQEVHHRVKNNFQMISSLLRLQATEMNDEKVQFAIEESINRLHSISLIHQKLYIKEDFHSISFKSYYESLIEQIQNSFVCKAKINIETQIGDFNIAIDNAVPLGLIINEIISNSYKHAFIGKAEGQIVAVIKKEKNVVKLKLSDNGVGLPEKFEAFEKSFGATLITLLVEQVEGKINYYNDNGAVFEIEFQDILKS